MLEKVIWILLMGFFVRQIARRMGVLKLVGTLDPHMGNVADLPRAIAQTMGEHDHA